MHFSEIINSEIVLLKKSKHLISEYFSINGFQLLKLLDK